MGKFIKGDKVLIKVADFKFGCSVRDLLNPKEPVTIEEIKADGTSYFVRVIEKDNSKVSYRMDESELEMYEPKVNDSPFTSSATIKPSVPKIGFRNTHTGIEVKNLPAGSFMAITNGDRAIRHAQNSYSISPRKFKLGDKVTIHDELVDLYFGGIAQAKGQLGTVVNASSDSPASAKTKSAHILVSFPIGGKYSMFESETREFYQTSDWPNTSSVTQIVSKEEAKKLGYVESSNSFNGERKLGKITRSQVGESVIKTKTRDPHIIISNTKTIIIYGRGNTGRKVQSAYF